MGLSNFEAIVLAIDPALHTSGAVILAPDYGNPVLGEETHPFRGDYYLAEYGKVTTQAERERFVQTMLDLSEELSEEHDIILPPIVVAEEWDGPRDRRIRLPGGEIGWARDPRWTYRTIMGIGEGWGRWSAEIEVANEVRLEEKISPEIILVRKTPNIWRDAVFGENRPKDTDSLKAAAVRFFKGVFGFDVSEDVAEAGCIGVCGLIDPEIAAFVGTWRDALLDMQDKAEAEERTKRNKRKKQKKRR
jgi:hypothetical protein